MILRSPSTLVIEIRGPSIPVEEKRLSQFWLFFILDEPLRGKLLVESFPDLAIPAFQVGIAVFAQYSIRRHEVVFHVKGEVTKQSPGLILTKKHTVLG